MPEARKLLLNPADKNQGYIVWSHGRWQPFGGAPPMDFPRRYDADPVWDGQVIDWTTPSAVMLVGDGAIEVAGGASGYRPGTANSFRIWRFLSAHPDGSGRSYIMNVFGGYEKYGLNVPNLMVAPPTFGYDAVRDWHHDWTSGNWIMLLANGGIHSSTGVTGYTGPVKPGRDVYRGLAIRSWTATPAFWVADFAGSVFRGNGAEEANRGPWFPGRDVVRDIGIVSDGTAGEPLIIRLLTAPGGFKQWTASTPPAVGVNEPVGPVTTTTRPEIRWTYTDYQRDAQAAYDVRIFSAAQYGATGFDPETSLAADRIHGTDRTVFTATPTRDLANGSWRAYVRARDTAGQLSPWGFREWTQNVTRPTAPTLAASPGGMWSTVLTVSGAGVAANFVDVEGSDDQVTWVPVRGSGVNPANGSLIIVDREPPLNAPRWYRARVRQADPTVTSPWSTEVPATVLEPAEWLISEPETTEAPTVVSVVPPFVWSEPTPTGVQRPPGRFDAIAARFARQSAEADLKIRTMTQADHRQIEKLYDGTRTLLLRSPYGEHWYHVTTGDLGTEMMQLAPITGESTVFRHAHETTVHIVEVGRPDV